jgi:CDGSH-type Zn-finger protein
MSAKGPYMIKGYKVIVVDSEGNEIEKEGTVALCRCGLSNKKPFCDGAHRNCETL